jgi:methylase of polypeptide subunit release factors
MLNHIIARHQGVSARIEYDEDAYEPGSLTATLCDIMDVRPGDRVIDVGCGTGYIGIVASLLGASKVIGIDPVPEALEWTRHNVNLNNIHNLNTKAGKALDPVTNEKVDVIVSLPPQMPFPTEFNPWRYGGPDGADVLVEIIRQAGNILKKENGRLYLVHAAIANPARVREALRTAGFGWEIVKTVEKTLERPDLEQLAPGLTNYLVALWQKGVAEIESRGGQYYYSVWFYRAELI